MCSLSGLYVGVNAGGWSRRWGGMDKALQFVEGRRLIEQVLQGFEAIPLLGVCVRSAQLSGWSELGYPLCIESEALPGQGPLRGIYTLLLALRQEQGEWLLLLPCDMPNVTTGVLQALIERQRRSGALCVSLRDSEDRDAMVALIHHSCAESLYVFLQQGGCRYRDWLARIQATATVWRGREEVLLNVNRPPNQLTSGYLDGV